MSTRALGMTAERTEARRLKLLAASRRYTAELVAEVGQPTAQERASAAALAKRIAVRKDRYKGPLAKAPRRKGFAEV